MLSLKSLEKLRKLLNSRKSLLLRQFRFAGMIREARAGAA